MDTVKYDLDKALHSGVERPSVERPSVANTLAAKAPMSIVTVAKRAGVSVATVSRVLNDLPNVRAETARQVRDAIEQVGYKPPRVKRGPKTGMSRAGGPARVRTGQIAVLTLGSGAHWLELPVMA